MTDYERLAQAAELRGLAGAARIRAHALEAAADRVDDQGIERVRRLGNYAPTRIEQRQNKLEHDAYITREVAAGRMCPGGCDRVVGGCFEHADRC